MTLKTYLLWTSLCVSCCDQFHVLSHGGGGGQQVLLSKTGVFSFPSELILTMLNSLFFSTGLLLLLVFYGFLCWDGPYPKIIAKAPPCLNLSLVFLTWDSPRKLCLIHKGPEADWVERGKALRQTGGRRI